MLELAVEFEEMFDEATDTFIRTAPVKLQLEHSLFALSKWESFFKKPFLSNRDKPSEEIFGYIEAMNQTPDVAPEVFSRLSPEHINKVNDYINDPLTATTFANTPGTKRNTDIITAELIYYWMIAFTIPPECQYWHLNRLLALIQVCNIKNSKPKKMSRAEAGAKQRELNEQRKREFGTTG